MDIFCSRFLVCAAIILCYIPVTVLLMLQQTYGCLNKLQFRRFK